jgi:hypothetical protein
MKILPATATANLSLPISGLDWQRKMGSLMLCHTGPRQPRGGSITDTPNLMA